VTNLLEMIPRRDLEWATGEDGRIRILVPRFGGNALGRRLAAWIGRPHIPVRLDAIGSAIWQACDGASTVDRIARHLEERFGDEVAPAHDRLATFLAELERNRFISWVDRERTGAPPGAGAV
jgi:hypothetical protein